MASEREFEPPLPGSWTWTSFNFDTANHEAAHTLACFLLGVKVYEARIDRPIVSTDRGLSRGVTLGYCKHEKPQDRDDVWKNVAISLAPHVITKRVPEFPSHRGDDMDEFWAWVATKELDMSKERYDEIIGIMTEFFNLDSSKRALTALSTALLDHGALPGDRLWSIYKEASEEQPSLSRPPVRGEE